MALIEKAMVPIHLDHQSPIPLYYQLQQQLRAAIQDGRLPVDAALPTEPTLAESVGVSRFTVRQAIEQLVREGLIRRERGRGTFVAAPRMRAGGLAAGGGGGPVAWRTLAVACVTPAPAIAAWLLLAADEPAVEVVRLRLEDGVPVAVETSYLPVSLGTDLAAPSLTSESLYDWLEARHGLAVTRADEVLEAARVEGVAAEWLAVSPGGVGFQLERRTYADQRPVEFRITIIAGERHQFRAVRRRPELA